MLRKMSTRGWDGGGVFWMWSGGVVERCGECQSGESEARKECWKRTKSRPIIRPTDRKKKKTRHRQLVFAIYLRNVFTKLLRCSTLNLLKFGSQKRNSGVTSRTNTFWRHDSYCESFTCDDWGQGGSARLRGEARTRHVARLNWPRDVIDQRYRTAMTASRGASPSTSLSVSRAPRLKIERWCFDSHHAQKAKQTGIAQNENKDGFARWEVTNTVALWSRRKVSVKREYKPWVINNNFVWSTIFLQSY